MHISATRRLESIRLPIVDVDSLVRILTNPNTSRSLVGARRQVVMKAVQVLNKALRDQIDGNVELDDKDVGLVLQAAALTIELQGDLLFFQFDDDEQS